MKDTEQGKLEWLKERIKLGVQRGMDKNVKMGEQLALLKTAKTLLSDGISVEKIAILTGLTETEIKKLMANKAKTIK